MRGVAGSSREMLKAALLCAAGLILAGSALAGQNPCGAKNACAARNPCAAAMGVDPKLVIRPAGTTPYAAPRADLVAEGERLWKSTGLSTNGMACETCHHNGGAFNASFAQPYPHTVEMPKARFGIQQVTAEEMVQFCMVTPMAAKPLPWNSRELAALTAYAGEVQGAFIKAGGAAAPVKAANPCGARNACAAKNPRAGGNPCAAKRD